MKSILIVSFTLLVCLFVLASCENSIKTKIASKDSVVLESRNNENTIEFMFKNTEKYPLIGVKLIRQTPIEITNTSSQQSSEAQSQQSSEQTSTTQQLTNDTLITESTEQQQSDASAQAESQGINRTEIVVQDNPQAGASAQADGDGESKASGDRNITVAQKQDGPQAGATAQAGGDGASSDAQASATQAEDQNTTVTAGSTAQSTEEGATSTAQSSVETNPVTPENTSISGDHQMDLTPNTTHTGGHDSSQPAVDNSTYIDMLNETIQDIQISPKDINVTNIIGRIIGGENITQLINETLGNVTDWLDSSMNDTHGESAQVDDTTPKDINITDIIGKIFGENITQLINETLDNATEWINSTLHHDNNDENSQETKRASLHRRLLSILEPKEEEMEYSQYLKFNKLKLLSSEGDTIKEIPLSDSNINWNYGHSVLVSNDKPFRAPHVDVEIPLSTASNRPTLKIRTMMTESPSHVKRNGRDVQLQPNSMDIQISLNNLHDLLNEQEKKLSGTSWAIETEMTSSANSLHLIQTKKLNGVQRVVVMGNNFTPKGQFTFYSAPHMKVIQDSDNNALISIQVHDSSNSIQLNPIKFGVQ